MFRRGIDPFVKTLFMADRQRYIQKKGIAMITNNRATAKAKIHSAAINAVRIQNRALCIQVIGPSKLLVHFIFIFFLP